LPVSIAALSLLVLLARANYLLFHSVVELFAIAVAWTVFALLVSARRFVRDVGLGVLGGAFLFVGGIDLLHTLSYKGMGVLGDSGANRATQFWIAGRVLEAGALLLGALLTGRSMPERGFRRVLAAQSGVAGLLVVSIFAGWFPTCYVEGGGLTTFKVAAEYAVCAALAAAGGLFWLKRGRMDRRVLMLLLASVALTIVSELAFTLYVDVFGLMNIAGHVLKVISFCLVYVAFVQQGLTRPYQTLFRSFLEEEEQNRRLERRIQDARRMESLGVLAGGIAHDFNNLLAAIMGNTELALRALPADSRQQKNLQAVLEATGRARNLTRQMLAYTGAMHLEAAPADLNELLAQMQGGMRRLLPENVDVEWVRDSDLPPVEIDTEQIRQVIAALLTNAVEAIGDKPGKLRLATCLCRVAGDDVTPAGQTESLEPGLYVVLEVADNGQGMDPRTLENALDPFFSTKFTGRGLGLPAACGVLRSHGGGLLMESSPGEGTEARVYLPAADRPRSGFPAPLRAESPVAVGG
jgi:signal transduction histidine kinase